VIGSLIMILLEAIRPPATETPHTLLTAYVRRRKRIELNSCHWAPVGE